MKHNYSNDFYLVADTNNIFGYISKYDIFYKNEVMSITEDTLKDLLKEYVQIMEEEFERKQSLKDKQCHTNVQTN